MDKAHLSIVRHCPQVASSVLPAVILVLLPKCPVCIAAYIAMATGIGLSLPVTAHLRTLLVILCATSLIYFVARLLHRRLALGASS
jgi:sterol desaturase/sphingolipid hydroxylase (fatty acid hydroxylase superfamily)